MIFNLFYRTRRLLCVYFIFKKEIYTHKMST
jgi:hypothetical protein